MRQFKVPSKSGVKKGLQPDDPGAKHIVTAVEIQSREIWTCDCLGFQYKKRCSHIEVAKAYAAKHAPPVIEVGLTDDVDKLLDSLLPQEGELQNIS